MPTYRFDLLYKAIRNHAHSGKTFALNGAQGHGKTDHVVAPSAGEATTMHYSRVSEFSRPDATVSAVMVDGCYMCGAATATGPIGCICGRPKFRVSCQVIPTVEGLQPIWNTDLVLVAWDATSARHLALANMTGWSNCDLAASKIVHSIEELGK